MVVRELGFVARQVLQEAAEGVCVDFLGCHPVPLVLQVAAVDDLLDLPDDRHAEGGFAQIDAFAQDREAAATYDRPRGCQVCDEGLLIERAVCDLACHKILTETAVHPIDATRDVEFG